MQEDKGLSLDEIYLKILSDKKIIRDNEIAIIMERNERKDAHRKFIYENFSNMSIASSSSSSGGNRVTTSDILWADGSNIMWTNNENVSFP